MKNQREEMKFEWKGKKWEERMSKQHYNNKRIKRTMKKCRNDSNKIVIHNKKNRSKYICINVLIRR